MIHLGLSRNEKRRRVAARVEREHPARVVCFSPPRFRLELDVPVPVEYVAWDEIILYKFFYRLLQEIDGSTLVVVNECLRTTNRADLTYNCLRNYLTRTERPLVFSRFPALESPDDFMILVDFDTRSRWRRSRIDELGEAVNVELVEAAPDLRAVPVVTDAVTRTKYAAQKRALIDGIGAKDPHTIPRQLHLLGGKHKASAATEIGGLWVGRNGRLKVPGFACYDEANERRQVLEFCHSYRDWADYLTASEATQLTALVSDLRADSWYLERYQQWTEMQRNAYAAIRHHLGS